jgi:hypothetical protein
MVRKKNQNNFYFWIIKSQLFLKSKNFFFLSKIKFKKLTTVMETEFNKSDTKNCSYCSKPFTKELWCKECDPCRIMEGWTDTMYKPTIEHGRS